MLHWGFRTVYFSKMGNAARLAAKIPEADLNDLPRIASGEARQVCVPILQTKFECPLHRLSS
jgi:hypothetical protein